MRTSFRCSLLAKCHYAHRLPVSEGFAVTFMVMLSKSVDYVQPRTNPVVWSCPRATSGARHSLAFSGLACYVRHRTDGFDACAQSCEDSFECKTPATAKRCRNWTTQSAEGRALIVDFWSEHLTFRGSQ